MRAATWILVGPCALPLAAHLRNELARAQVGTEPRVTILRGGRRRELRIPVEEASPSA